MTSIFLWPRTCRRTSYLPGFRCRIVPAGEMSQQVHVDLDAELPPDQVAQDAGQFMGGTTAAPPAGE